jgi:nucleoside-diphosphate-sugar epimerase
VDFTVAEPFVEIGSIAPHSDYAQSKWEAEQVLHIIAQQTGLEVVIVRPPLVYGIDAPGNFYQMIKVLQKRVPLPFSAVRNKRSFIYVLNLVDALMACAIIRLPRGNIW